MEENRKISNEQSLEQFSSLIPKEIYDYVVNNSKVISSELHGPNHWWRVYQNAIMLDTKEENKPFYALFAFLHDFMRTGDGVCKEHGHLAANIISKKFNSASILGISALHFFILTTAVSRHTDLMPVDLKGSTSMIVELTRNCLDADRLDIGRVGFTVDPKYLFTDRAKEIAKGLYDGL